MSGAPRHAASFAASLGAEVVRFFCFLSCDRGFDIDVDLTFFFQKRKSYQELRKKIEVQQEVLLEGC